MTKKPDLSALLETYTRLLTKDRDIVQTEQFEKSYKLILKKIAASGDPELAFHAALTQKRIGFILKYKSYGIKAATPLGFSLFFLEPGEGFSFQRHRNFKTETLHFISTRSRRNFAYLCDSDEWDTVYEPTRFSKWLRGSPDATIGRHCYRPVPGDVMRIERTNMVHTAIGCVLEEYANTSTDMVDRLHDQNKEKTIPKKFSRSYFRKKLLGIRYPKQSALVMPRHHGFVSQPLKMSVAVEGVTTVTLSKTKDFIAQRLTIPPGKIWKLGTKNNFVSAFLSDGHTHCTMLLKGRQHDNGSFDLDSHEIFFSVPRCEWRITNRGPAPTRFSVLFVPKKIALR